MSGQLPTTQWSELMSGVRDQDDVAWSRFLSVYRRPVGNILRRFARVKDGRSADELADDFFGWFASRQIHLRIERDGKDGRRHFRGYLLKCLRTFARDHLVVPGGPSLEVVGQPAGDPHDHDAIFLEEYCRDAMAETLQRLRLADPTLCEALLMDARGHTLADTIEALRTLALDAPGSVTSAHRQRQRARRALLRLLLRYRLEQEALSSEEAVTELHELIPWLARALAEIAAVANTSQTDEPRQAPRA